MAGRVVADAWAPWMVRDFSFSSPRAVDWEIFPGCNPSRNVIGLAHLHLNPERVHPNPTPNPCKGAIPRRRAGDPTSPNAFCRIPDHDDLGRIHRPLESFPGGI